MWLKSYLTNISQKVAIKEALSKLDDLKVGVPQGSVLTPLLFINRIKDDTVEIKAEFILLACNIEYHYLSFIRIKFC
jgi:hypothetical protein